MGRLLDIAGGIALGGLVSLSGYAGLHSLAEYSVKKELQNQQTIRGTVVEENFTSHFMGDRYQVSIRTPEGRKVLASYNSVFSGLYEPATLNTLFAKGDNVELDVATNEEFGGDQRFVGLAGKLVEDKTE